MPYIENGREIGRDESRDYEYNGVTDRWYDAGPAVIRPESYPPEAIREMDRLAQEKKEEEERTRRTQQYKEQQESSRNAWIAWGREEAEAKRNEERKQREKAARQAEIKDFQERMEAYKKAKERYLSHSKLYQLFHKKPSYTMSVEKLDSMYQGRSR